MDRATSTVGKPGALAALGLVVALTVAGCSSSGSGKSSSSVGNNAATSGAAIVPADVTFTDQPNTGVTTLIDIAQQEGFFQQQGITATLSSVATGPAAATALASGSVQVATNATEVFSPLVSKGIKLQLIAGETGSLVVIVASKSLNAPTSFPASIAALKGKKVGVTALSSTTQYIMEAALKAAGLSPDAVTFVAVGANADPALAAGTIDAAVLTGGQIYRATAAGATTLLDMRQASTCPKQITICGLDQVGMWAQTSWVSSHQAVVQQIRRAIAMADQWVHSPANIDAVTKLLAQQVGSSASAAVQSQYVKDLLVPGALTAAFSKASLAAWLQFDLDNKFISSAINVDDTYAAGTPGSESDVAKLLAK